MKKILIKSLLAVVAFTFAASANAQSLSDVLNAVKQTAVKATGATISEKTLAGTWKYQSPAIEFESADVLKSLGGSALSSKINSRMEGVFTKVGLKKNVATFTFNSDKTFKYYVSSKNTGSGTWELKGSTLTLSYTTYLKKKRTVTGTVSYDGTNMELLLDANKLMDFINSVGTAASKYSTTINSLNTLIGSYDGMKVGLKFKK